MLCVDAVSCLETVLRQIVRVLCVALGPRDAVADTYPSQKATFSRRRYYTVGWLVGWLVGWGLSTTPADPAMRGPKGQGGPFSLGKRNCSARP